MLKVANTSESRQTLEMNYLEWGKGLSLESYIAREEYLLSRPFAASGRKCWILVEEDEIVSCCETYDRFCILNNKRGKCASIASVFTRPNQRRKGFAGKMMTLLRDRLLNDGYSCSTLYSDIGPLYYSKLGWKVYPSDIGELINNQLATFLADHSYWKKFSSTIQPEPIDLSQVHEVLKDAPIPDSTNSFLIPISGEPVDWLIARSIFYAERAGIKLETFGYKLKKEYVLFAHDFDREKIVVLTMNAVGGLDILLNACIEECIKFQLERLEIWDIVNHDACISQKRTRSLSSLLVLSGDCKIDWIGNEKAFWV